MEASLAKLWRPLGAILIERHLLSEEQLQRALIEQQQSGRRLGEVLVDLELVPRDVLISVLLEQCGLETETQNGFGSGLLSELRKRGSAHRRVVPLQVFHGQDEQEEPEPEVAPEPEAQITELTQQHVETSQPQDVPPDSGERRRRWGRRKSDLTSRERAERLAVAFATLEEWTTELQRELVEMRRLIADAAHS